MQLRFGKIWKSLGPHLLKGGKARDPVSSIKYPESSIRHQISIDNIKTKIYRYAKSETTPFAAAQRKEKDAL